MLQPILKSFGVFVKVGLIHHSVPFVLNKYEFKLLKKNNEDKQIENQKMNVCFARIFRVQIMLEQ